MGYVVDIGILLFSAVLSAYIAYRWKYIGFVFGVIIIWIFGIIKMEALMIVDPGYEPGVLGASWVAFGGWLFGIIWCLPFTVSKVISQRKEKALNQKNA